MDFIVEGLQKQLRRAKASEDEVEFDGLLSYLISKEAVFGGLIPLCEITLVGPTVGAEKLRRSLSVPLQAADPGRLTFERIVEKPTAVEEEWRTNVYSRLIDTLLNRPDFKFKTEVKEKLNDHRAAKADYHKDSKWAEEAASHLFVYVVKDEEHAEVKGHPYEGKWAFLDQGEFADD